MVPTRVEQVDEAIEAQREETVLLFRNAGVAFFGNVTSALLVAFVNGPARAMVGVASLWAACVLALSAARYVLARRFQAVQPAAAASATWRRRYLVATALLGALWGGGSVLFILDAPDNLRLLDGLVMVGVVAGAVPILAPVPAAFRLFAALVFLPTAAVMLAQASAPLHWVFGLTALVLPLALIASANHMHAVLDALIRMGLEKSRILGELRISEARVREIIDHSPIGMGIAGTDGRFLQVNHAMCAMLGYSAQELQRLTILDITHDDDRAGCADEHSQLISGRQARTQMEKRFVRKDSSVIWAQVTASLLRLPDGSACVLGQVEDITERRMWREQIYHDAYYDALTDLPNRRLLLDLANQALAEAHRRRRAAALLYVDVDRFKDINDALGHEAGDQLLQEVAARLKVSVRRGDIVSRQGGDEFVVVLTDLEQAHDAGAVATKILDAFAAPVRIGKGELRASISVGISLYPDDATEDVEELIHRADAAMYAAKLRGRGSYRYYHESAGALAHLDVLRRGGAVRPPRAELDRP